VLLNWNDMDCRGPILTSMRSTFQVKQTTGFYPRLKVDTTASGAVSQAGGVLLTETIAATGLGRALSAGLAP